jgi:hypothetical protein
MKGIFCSHCKNFIRQGRHYRKSSLIYNLRDIPWYLPQLPMIDCCNCDNDGFDLCHSCYRCGIRCQSPSKHTLQLNLVSDGTALSQFKDTCKRKGWATKTFAHSTCSRCTNTISTGYFWRSFHSLCQNRMAETLIKLSRLLRLCGR